LVSRKNGQFGDGPISNLYPESDCTDIDIQCTETGCTEKTMYRKCMHRNCPVPKVTYPDTRSRGSWNVQL